MGKIRQLGCSCCGGDAGKFEQWHNRDTGYGICVDCVAWLRQPTAIKPQRETEEDIRDYYGVEGVNFAKGTDR